MFAYEHSIHFHASPTANLTVGGVFIYMANSLIPFIPSLNNTSGAIGIKYASGIAQGVIQIRIDVPNHGLKLAIFIFTSNSSGVNSQCFCTPNLTSLSYRPAFDNPGCSVDAAWVNRRTWFLGRYWVLFSLNRLTASVAASKLC